MKNNVHWTAHLFLWFIYHFIPCLTKLRSISPPRWSHFSVWKTGSGLEMRLKLIITMITDWVALSARMGWMEQDCTKAWGWLVGVWANPLLAAYVLQLQLCLEFYIGQCTLEFNLNVQILRSRDTYWSIILNGVELQVNNWQCFRPWPFISCTLLCANFN